jgi:excisionase family DNA binding protein
MLLDIRQAAQHLGLGESTVRDLIAGGQLAALRVGRRILVEESALLEFIAERRSERAPRGAHESSHHP